MRKSCLSQRKFNYIYFSFWIIWCVSWLVSLYCVHIYMVSIYVYILSFYCFKISVYIILGECSSDKTIPSIFSVSVKFGLYYIMGQWSEFIKRCYLMVSYTFLAFFFFVFHHKICVFISFISFFDEVINFRNRTLTNQKHELVVSNCWGNCMLEKNYVGCIILSKVM